MKWQKLDKDNINALKLPNICYVGKIKEGETISAEFGVEIDDFIIFNYNDKTSYAKKGLIWDITGPDTLYDDDDLLEKIVYFCPIDQPKQTSENKECNIWDEIEPIKMPERPEYRKKQDEEYRKWFEQMTRVCDELKGPASQQYRNIKTGKVIDEGTEILISEMDNWILIDPLNIERITMEQKIYKCPKCQIEMSNNNTIIKMPLKIAGQTIWICENCWLKFYAIKELIENKCLADIDDAYSVFIKTSK